MNKKISAPRGTADILPQDISIWKNIETKARTVSSNYGYREIRTPVFEETELFVRSVGKTSDIVQKQMLNLASQRQTAEEEVKLSGLSLRPEGTAPIVRSYIENNLDRKEKLSKLFYIGPMFRGERPQKGRLRQFHQIGVEAIGPESCEPYLDAEIIALSVHILGELGVGDFDLKINTLGPFEAKEKIACLLTEKLKSDLHKLCDDCRTRFHRNVFRVLDCKNKACKAVVEKIGFGPDWLDADSRKYFQDVRDALDDLKIPYTVDGNLVRGLDYYTHTVFEISGAALGSQDALGAGGRYNNLVSQLGGPEVDAVGFALGIERLILSLSSSDQAVAQNPLDAYVIALDGQSMRPAFQILNALRRQGIASDSHYRVASLKSQMRSADKSGARYVLILGESERQKGVITLKDMTSGQQEEITIQDNCARLASLIKQKGIC